MDQFCHSGSTSNKNPVTPGKVQPGFSSEQQISWIDSQKNGVLLVRARNDEIIGRWVRTQKLYHTNEYI
jgi:hypothetical protein